MAAPTIGASGTWTSTCGGVSRPERGGHDDEAGVGHHQRTRRAHLAVDVERQRDRYGPTDDDEAERQPSEEQHQERRSGDHRGGCHPHVGPTDPVRPHLRAVTQEGLRPRHPLLSSPSTHRHDPHLRLSAARSESRSPSSSSPRTGSSFVPLTVPVSSGRHSAGVPSTRAAARRSSPRRRVPRPPWRHPVTISAKSAADNWAKVVTGDDTFTEP